MTAEQRVEDLNREIDHWDPNTTDQHYESLVEERDNLLEWIEQGYRQ